MLYNITYSTPIKEYFNLLHDILAYLAMTPVEWSDEKIFMVLSVENDSPFYENNFDILSSYGSIGVLANSQTMGYVLLLFLRMLIDSNLNLVRRIYDDKKQKHNLEMSDIIRTLRKYEMKDTKIFSKDDTINITFNGANEIALSKNIQMIDLWTLQRIQKEFNKIISLYVPQI